jgi:hypothetical protein
LVTGLLLEADDDCAMLSKYDVVQPNGGTPPSLSKLVFDDDFCGFHGCFIFDAPDPGMLAVADSVLPVVHDSGDFHGSFAIGGGGAGAGGGAELLSKVLPPVVVALVVDAVDC